MANYRKKLQEDVSGFHVPCDGKPAWCTSYKIACLFFRLFGPFHL